VSAKSNTPPSSGSSLLKQGLDKVLGRFSRSGQQLKPPTNTELNTLSHLTLCWRLEEIFLNNSTDTPWPQELLKFALAYSGLSWGFLTEVLAGDPNHFVIMAGQPFPSGLEPRQPKSSGLAGYVHTSLQPLAIPSIKSLEEFSFIFHPGEPIKRAVSFYAWPLVYNDSLRGSLLLIGKSGQLLSDNSIHFLDFLALRLSSHYQQDKLFNWALELNLLDPQSGLPHRTYFIQRLEQLIETHQDEGVTLALLSVSGLGRYAMSFGQQKTADLLKILAKELLNNSGLNWELGHLSYGLFALAVPTTEKSNLDNTIFIFKKVLDTWVIHTRTGRKNFVFYQSISTYPTDGLKPEMLLEVALSNLAELEE
jgi:GGDEF domain-containing protein